MKTEEAGEREEEESKEGWKGGQRCLGIVN